MHQEDWKGSHRQENHNRSYEATHQPSFSLQILQALLDHIDFSFPLPLLHPKVARDLLKFIKVFAWVYVHGVTASPLDWILGHGKKIHCFSGNTFPSLEAVGRFFLINSVGKFPGNHKQERKSVASYRSSTAAVVPCSTNNDEKRYSYCTRYCKQR